MVRCGESTLIKGRWVSSRSARVYEHHFDVIESKLLGRIFAAKGCVVKVEKFIDVDRLKSSLKSCVTVFCTGGIDIQKSRCNLILGQGTRVA